MEIHFTEGEVMVALEEYLQARRAQKLNDLSVQEVWAPGGDSCYLIACTAVEDE